MGESMKRSQAQEKRGVKLHGGSRNAGSGNTPWRKNDVRLDGGFLIEYKTTTGRNQSQITIRAKDTEDVWRNAILDGRDPAFGIEVGGRDWVMVPADVFERLRSADSAAATGSIVGLLRDDEDSELVLPPVRPRVQKAANGRQGGVQRATGDGGRARPPRVPGKGAVS